MENLMKGYTDEIRALCANLDKDGLSQVLKAFKKAYDENRRIIVAGNGGSAATANHFFCDFSKNAVKNSEKRAKIISLASNVEAITAVGNDISFEEIFVEQMKNLMEEGDLVLLISASGNSPDIVRAAEYAKSKNGVVAGFTGFSGGKLKEIADVSVHITSESYEQIEDIHLMLTHIIVCYFKSLNL